MEKSERAINFEKKKKFREAETHEKNNLKAEEEEILDII